jgi:hypothetical protein
LSQINELDDKLRKLIKRSKKQRGLRWSSVVSKLELAAPMSGR